MDWVKRLAELTEPQVNLVKQLEIIRKMRRKMRKPQGYRYLGKEDYLLQHGEWYAPIPLPADFTLGDVKQCFAHSINVCVRDPSLRYVEGVASCEDIDFAVDHAWATDRDRRLLDGVWRNRGTAYLGCTFPTGIALDILRRGATVFNNPLNRFAIYRWPREAE